MTTRVGLLITHPIQYYVPWYRGLAAVPGIDLKVFFAHRQDAKGQAAAGYGVAFEWDIPLLDGYPYEFLTNVARRPSVSGFFGCDTPEIAGAIAAGGFDVFIVQGWHVKSYWQAIRACRKAGVPILVRGDSHLHTRRSWFRRAIKYIPYRWFIPTFDAYLVVGLWNREYYEHYGAAVSRMFAVPHAVDNQFFQMHRAKFEPERAVHREAMGISSDTVVFLFAGRLVAEKRPMDFLRALRILVSEGRRVSGIISGDGILKAEMQAYVREHQLPVTFVGFLNQTEIPRAYALSDALVLPSRVAETWGLVVNEAMASGLPALVSDGVGCGPDLILPGETGWVYPAENIPALARVMRRLSDDPSIIKKMGAKAQEHIRQFSVEKAVEGTLKAIEHVKKS